MDRSELVSLIDRLISVDGGEQIGPDDGRPVVVLEGAGGSGRSTAVRALWNKWATQTPTAWIDPRLIAGPDVQEMRPVLLAVMRGLSAPVEGFRVRFPRVITAYIAMREAIEDEEPGRASEAMLERIVRYGDRNNLIDLLGGLLTTTADAVESAHPGDAGALAAAATKELAPRLVARFRRSPTALRGPFHRAVEWFGHQDRGFNFEPLAALVRLSCQAGIPTEAVRQDVDELLVAALLADLRESLGSLANRPFHALVLLDNGDVPMARAFVEALVRVQGRHADPLLDNVARPPDPVTVVTVSGGALVEDLVRLDVRTTRGEGSGRAGTSTLRRGDVWVPVQLGEFTEDEVQSLTQKRMWPATLGSSTVSYLTYRLTGGHAEATVLALRALETDPTLVDDLNRVLRNRSSTDSATLEERVLKKIVDGLQPRHAADPSLRRDLVTLAAARNADEVESLAGLLGSPRREQLLTSNVLWSGRRTALPPLSDGSRPSPVLLAPIVRYLGLRALADRPDDDEAGWRNVFGVLLRVATDKDDHTGRLHHELALGRHDAVVDELVGLLPQRPDDEWLGLLDDVTATPDPRRHVPEPSRPAVADPTVVVARLVDGQHAVSDPCVSGPEGLRHRYHVLSNDFRLLAGGSRSFLQRAEYYSQLASGRF